MESLRKVWIGKVEKLEKLDRAMQKKNDERNRKAYQNQLESMTNVAKSGSFKGLTFEGNSVTEVRELVHGRLQSLEREFNKAFSEFYDCLGQPDRVSDVKRVRERLLNLSRVLAQDLDSMQRNIQGNVPKMSTSLFSGGKLYGGTSGGEKAKVENLHPLLQYLLAKVPESHKGKGHGGCAEIRVLSKYIHAWQRQNEKLLERKGISSDSYDALVKELRRHFERGGAITSAHFLGEDSIYGVAACETCRSVQEHLGVSWLPGEKDEEDRVTWYNQSSGKLVAARAGRDSPETPRRSTPHQRPMSAAADPAEGNPNGN
ncbi:hypothetical protein SSP24_84080 [Streptomyces spinoverrucosus]|uniref:Uncharacterized protein n=2 Tax=Streptomyces spinoverrucosus TaxID=284043 RepID=A0A4Y3VVR1_9ACTN|nr:hypothetical protein SSP24_84080 [Streptomyces spinoverrucosus]GHC00051.1 hypothetical protein GCM10010397_85070 [Streptomyces spinoverrucosus]